MEREYRVTPGLIAIPLLFVFAGVFLQFLPVWEAWGDGAFVARSATGMNRLFAAVLPMGLWGMGLVAAIAMWNPRVILTSEGGRVLDWRRRPVHTWRWCDVEYCRMDGPADESTITLGLRTGELRLPHLAGAQDRLFRDVAERTEAGKVDESTPSS